MKPMKFLLSAALALCLAPAFAQESVRNFYVGVHGGQAHWRLCPVGQTCEDISGTLRVLAGYQINSIFSGEVSGVPYLAMASSSASTQKSAVMLIDTRCARTRRVAQSMMATRYTKPRRIGM